MTDKNEIDFIVEADARQAAGSVRDVSKEIGQLLGQAAKLEQTFQRIFQDQLPKDVQNFGQAINQARIAAGRLASGGPSVSIQNAALQGQIQQLRADPIAQVLRLEQETNKVLAARAEIYRRIRDVLPANASERRVTQAYRSTLTQLGAPVDNKQTLNEVRQFEAERTRIEQEAAVQRDRVQAEAENRSFDRRAKLIALSERREAERINRRLEQDRAGQERLIRQEAEFENRRLEQQQSAIAKRDRQTAESLNKQYAQTVAGREKLLRAEAEADNREFDRRAKLAARSAARQAGPTVDERNIRTRNAIQARQDYFSYQGGAAALGLQAASLANYAAIGGVIGSFGFAGSSVVQFQSAMKDVQAIAAATNLEMKDLTKTIFDVGSTTKLSTKDIAEGAKILAQAGYSVQQIQQMIKPIADLAVGSGSTLEDAANTVTSVLSIFDMSITRTSEVSNTLVAGLNKSKLSMDQLGTGIQYAGNAAAAGGVQFNEMVAALGAMANAGIKSGSTLGTGLRSIIVNLENPTKKFRDELGRLGLKQADVDIKTHGLINVMELLKARGFDSAAAFAAMGQRAGAAYTALSNNLNVFSDLTKSIQGTTAAQDAASVQMDTFSSQWQRLLNAVTEFATLGGGPVLGALTAMVGGLASLLSAATPLAPVLQFIAAALTAWAATSAIAFVARLAAGLLTGLTPAVLSMNIALIGAIEETEGLTGAIGILMGETGIGLLVLVLAGVIMALGHAQGAQAAFNAELEKSQTAQHKATAEAQEYQQRARELDTYIEMLSNRHALLAQNTQLAGTEAQNAVAKFGSWGLALDGVGNHVDGLIGKVVALRGQMAQLAHQKLLDAKTDADKAGRDLDSQIDKGRGNLKYRAGVLLGRGNLVGGNLRPEERAALQALARGDLSLSTVVSAQGVLRNAISRGGPQAAPLQGLLDQLAPVAGLVGKRTQNLGDITSLNTQLADTAIAGSPQGTSVYGQAQVLLNGLRDAEFKANQIKNPAERNKALAALEPQKQAATNQLKALLAQASAQLANDPDVMAGIKERAALNGTTVQQEISNQFVTTDKGVSELLAMSGDIKSTDVGALTSRAKRLEADARVALQAHDTARYRKLRDQAKQVRTQAAYAKYMASGEDPDAIEGRVADDEAAFDDKTKLGLRGAANKGNPNAKRKAEADVKRLEEQITNVLGNAGPGAEDIKAVQPQLEKLLQQWEDAKKRAISASPGDAASHQAQLAELAEASKKFRAQVLSGNMEAALQAIAILAKETAEKTTAIQANELETGKTDFTTATAKTVDAIEKATQAQIDVINQKASAKNLDPAKAHEYVEQRRKTMQDGLKQIFDAIDRLLQASLQELARQVEDAQVQEGHDRAKVATLNNFYGRLNLGDTHRFLGEQRTRQLDEAALQRDFSSKQKAFALTATAQDELKTKYDASVSAGLDTGDLAAQMQKAEDATRAARIEMEKARDALEAATGKATGFKSISEAIAASWERFKVESGVQQNPLETLADGFTNVWETAHQGFTSFLTDVLSGTKSLKIGIRDLAVSIAKAFLDMAVKLLANQAFMWILSLFTHSAPGSFNGAAIQPGGGFTFTAAQGGMVPKRYAQGGFAAYRDSVPSLLMPGEVVMNTSAVDMIGADTLMQMNRQGHRRLSQMPTVGQAMPQRQPDTANVWIVAPEKRPPSLGPRDVIAVVSDDLLTGGKTKQLVKAIQMGAA